MHEFSIAVNITEIAIDTASKHNAEKVSEVVIEVGDISGVVYEALELALQSAVKNTILEDSHLVIKRISANAVCNHCGYNFNPEDMITVCNTCGSTDIKILSGKELRVKSIRID